MTLWPALLAGALLGAGATAIIAAWVPARPDLRTALARLDPATSSTHLFFTDTTATGRVRQIRARVLSWAVETFRLTRFSADLHLVQEIPLDLAARKLGFTLLGLAFPPFLVAIVAAAGFRPPVVIPVLASLTLGGVLFFTPDLDVRRRASSARAALRRATCVFLELVALERAADAGTTEALDRAARIGTSPEFDRIRDALLSAELAGRPPWTGLTDLAETTGVTELADVADIMRLSGQNGAAVYTTLRARAASLRTQLLTTATAEANEASEHMVIPMALLGLTFMALLAYPALVRLLYA